METTKKIGIYNNKGGVAKTTSVINIAYSLHKNGKTVLVVDCDRQENCFSFFMENTGVDNVLPTAYENIAHTTWQRYSKLNDEEIQGYDIVLFDLPPTLSDEVKMIIKHCNVIYVPTLIGEFEISGLRNVTEEINRQGVKLGGIFVTMYQAQTDSEEIEDMRRMLQKRMMQTVIPYSKTVRVSQKEGLPIEAYFISKKVPHNKNSWKIVDAYEELTQEIMKGA